MPRTRSVIALVLVIAPGCATPAAERRAPAPPPVVYLSSAPLSLSAIDAQAEIQDLVARINRHRGSLGCPALRRDDRLATVALQHSQDMARRRFFSHTNPDGRDPFDRMRLAGIRFQAAAENLASGQITGVETFEGWMDSPGHRRNLENCVYTRIGIGLHRNRWTCMLSRPAS